MDLRVNNRWIRPKNRVREYRHRIRRFEPYHQDEYLLVEESTFFCREETTYLIVDLFFHFGDSSYDRIG